MISSASDRVYMREAFRLARYGRGRTSPNPMVGAVVVRGGMIVGRGYHERAGGPHAEVSALEDAGSLSRGGTLYVSLEPCAHYGRTPPCVDLVISSGIVRVVCGLTDPNPIVSGRGIDQLRSAGIEVVVGLMEDDARRLIEAYAKYIVTRLPFVTLKLALSADGRIATGLGESRWITGPEARRRVHEMRAESDAVMVGTGTALADDPLLDIRLATGKASVKIVVDSLARLSPIARLLKGSRAVIAVGQDAPPDRVERLRAAGAEVWEFTPGGDGRIDPGELLARAGLEELSSVLIEGGGRLAASFLRAQMVDRIALFTAPILLGGEGVPSIGSLALAGLADAPRIHEKRVEHLGADLLCTGYIRNSPRLLDPSSCSLEL